MKGEKIRECAKYGCTKLYYTHDGSRHVYVRFGSDFVYIFILTSHITSLVRRILL